MTTTKKRRSTEKIPHKWLTLAVLMVTLNGCGGAPSPATPSAIPATRTATARLTDTPNAETRLMGTSTAYVQTAAAFEATFVETAAALSATYAAQTARAPTLPPLLPARAPVEIITGNLAGGSWSPDGRWIAFWRGDQPIGFQLIPSFYRVATGEICIHEEFSGVFNPEYSPSYTYWLPDSRAVVVTDQKPYTGQPCGDFTQGGPTAEPWNRSFSPDGRYLASAVLMPDGVTVRMSIEETATGAVLNTVEWPGSMMNTLPVRWIDDRRLLLARTSDRGPLLVQVGGAVIDVAPELFGLELADYEPNDLWAGGAINQATGSLHVLLRTADASSPEPMLLYHGESGVIEEIPFREMSGFSTRQGYVWGFSPDGGWLLLRTPFAEVGHGILSDWVRPVEGTQEDAVIFSELGGALWWSGSTGLAAYPHFDDGSVMIVTFPEGIVTQRWAIAGYELGPQEWSPDGKKLLLMGWSESALEWALFLAEVAP